jgi:hypothetical protein
MHAKTALRIISIVIPSAGLLLVSVACSDTTSSYSARPAGTRMPASAPTPTSHVGNLFDTQEAANAAADSSMQTAVANQLTAEAVNVTVTAQNIQTEEAREQILFDISLTNMAKTAVADEAKATQSAQETAIARQDATGTAQARADEATATAWGHATRTSEAHIQETEVAKPTVTALARIQDEEAAEHRRRMRQLQWQENTTVLVEFLKMAGVVVLCGLGVVFLWWVLPRLYHAVELRLGGWRKHGARPTWALARYSTQRPERRGLTKVLGPVADFVAPWRGMQGMTTYVADRDPGSGQTIDIIEGTSRPLAGDPTTTALDLAADMLARPAACGGRVPSWSAAQNTARAVARPQPYQVLPVSKEPPKLIPEGDLEVLDAQWRVCNESE